MTRQGRLIQIDILKGIAILFVIIARSLPSKILGQILYLFYFEQAVPVFVIITGINLFLSFNRRNLANFSEVYQKFYWTKRAKRILIPFFVVFVLALLTGYLMNQTELSWLMLLGKFPFHGPGNYYLSFVLQFTVLVPLLYILFRKRPVITLVVGFLVSLFFELAAPHVNFLSNGSYIYSLSFFRYMSAVLMGFYLAQNEFKLNKMYLALIPMPLILFYIFKTEASSYYIPQFLSDWGSQNLLSVFYPAFLILFGVNVFASEIKSRIVGLITFLGKFSYHVFLIQIIYFGFIRQTSVMNWPVGGRVVVNLVVCFGLGICLL